jgi:hypothetical protein
MWGKQQPNTHDRRKLFVINRGEDEDVGDDHGHDGDHHDAGDDDVDHSLPPAFYKLPRVATADMANRTGSTGQWAGVGSICGLYAYTMNALLGPDREMRPSKPRFWLVVAHLRQLGTFFGPNLLLLLPPVASSSPFYTFFCSITPSLFHFRKCAAM